MNPKRTGVSKSSTSRLSKAVEMMLPEIRELVEEARRRAVTAANLSMVTLSCDIVRIINTELQRALGRAEYGEGPPARLGERLRLDYGPGVSRSSLQDMGRFHEAFEICQTVSGKSLAAGICQPVASKSEGTLILSPVARESGERLQDDIRRRRRDMGHVLTQCATSGTARSTNPPRLSLDRRARAGAPFSRRAFA
jgi:hypothetical protein